jgi:hypothetical protein
MSRRTAALAVLALLAAFPAAAQEFGGVPLQGPVGPQHGRSSAVLGKIRSTLASGCPLSQTNLAIGTNRSFGGSQQQVIQQTSGGCRPLVSTQVVSGTNLALTPGSSADQTIQAQSQRGLLATNNIVRGNNFAVGARSSATQRLVGLTSR